MKSEKRPYNNNNRSQKSDKTKLNIINATGYLWTKHSIADISLELIAERSGITVRTILRKFGSKNELFEECLAYDSANISMNRNTAKPGDIDHIIRTLIDNYEEIGDAAIRTIMLESDMEIARNIGEKGRESHSLWCAIMFESFLPEPQNPQYKIDLSSFISATEVYLWKLLRKDLKMDKEQTIKVFIKLVKGLVSLNSKNKIK